jgi:hypothetical protein
MERRLAGAQCGDRFRHGELGPGLRDRARLRAITPSGRISSNMASVGSCTTVIPLH